MKSAKPKAPGKGKNQDSQDVQTRIARRAYELFEERGREHGHDQEDWLRAEQEILGQR